MLLQDGEVRPNEERLGRTVDAVVDRDVANLVPRRSNIGITERGQPVERQVALVLPVKTVNGHAGSRKAEEKIMLVATLDAPGRPDVQ